MNLGEILDRATQLFRAHFTLFIGLALFPGLTQLALQLASIHPAQVAVPSGIHTVLDIASHGLYFVLWVANIACQAIATAAICFATSRIYFGSEVTIRHAFRAYIPMGGRLVGLGFLQGIYAGWPLIFVLVISAALGSREGSLAAQVPLWILGSIPCVALYSRYALAYPACAIENLSSQFAIKRSVELGSGGRWRICWGFLLPGAIWAVLSFSSFFIIEQLKSGSPFFASNPLAVAGLDGVAILVSGLAYIPLSAIVLTLLYYDQRIRHEGYDIERMMDAAGLNAPATPPSGPTPSAPAEAVEGQA
jgi:hypothetical protein